MKGETSTGRIIETVGEVDLVIFMIVIEMIEVGMIIAVTSLLQVYLASL